MQGGSQAGIRSATKGEIGLIFSNADLSVGRTGQQSSRRHCRIGRVVVPVERKDDELLPLARVVVTTNPHSYVRHAVCPRVHDNDWRMDQRDGTEFNQSGLSGREDKKCATARTTPGRARHVDQRDPGVGGTSVDGAGGDHGWWRFARSGELCEQEGLHGWQIIDATYDHGLGPGRPWLGGWLGCSALRRRGIEVASAQGRRCEQCDEDAIHPKARHYRSQ